MQGPGAIGVHGPQAERPSSRRRASSSPSASASNGVKDFPDPANGRAPRRHESNPILRDERWHDVLNAAMQKCGASRRRGRRAGEPVRRKTWVLAAAAVLVAAAATGGVVVMSGAKQATAAAQEPPVNTATGGAGEALGHGLPDRDPDLPGATGRLAVRRDQPGPRDLHRAARGRRQGRLRRRALSGGRPAGAAAVRHGPGLPRRCRRATRAATSASSTRTCASSATRPGAGSTRFRRLRLRDGDGAQGAPARQGLCEVRPERWTSATRSFLPEPVRIAKVTGELGGSARPGAPVLHATSDTLEVQVDLDPSQQGEVKKGDRAQITLPGNTSVTGRVDRLGRVAQVPAGQDSQRRRARPSRPTSASTTRRRHAGSTGPRSRWTSRPRAWRAP